MDTVMVILTSKPEYGGEHQYLMLLMEALKKCDNKYFKVVAVCTNNFWLKWCKTQGISYTFLHFMPCTGKQMLNSANHPFLYLPYHRYATPLGKLIREHNVSILISGQQGIFLPYYGCKVIRPIHDLMHRYEPSFPEIASQYDEREALFGSVVKTSDLILVDSKLGKEQLLESYSKRKHDLRIAVLPFVVSDVLLKITEEKVDVPSKYIFYPAQFWSHKNHINLVKAVEILKKSIPDIKLILVGSEKNYQKFINRYIRENSLENQVSILGFVSNGQLKYLYQHATAMVMPSYFGPTNIPPLEAMALGCPVIVSNKYAMPDQVGDAGLSFNPDLPEEIAEKIKLVWQDERLRQKMIQDGYQRVRSWKDNDFKKRFIHIVLKILGR